MLPLELAPTIRTPRPDEVPQHADVLDSIQRRQMARIVEGYTLLENTSHEQPFAFFSEINVNNSKLWSLFQAFLLQMPDEVYFIYGHKDTEAPLCSPYKDKFQILNVLSPFEAELTQDGMLKFGVAFHSEDSFEEIFVMPAKYLQYWGTNEQRFNRIMEDYSLSLIQDLNFIDEFPLATEPLRMHKADVTDTEQLLNHFDSIFRSEE
jgi:hypothetical protein